MAHSILSSLPAPRISFAAGAPAGDDEVERRVLAALARAGLPEPAEVVLLERDGCVVVRVVAPGLEHFEPVHRRVGPRLRSHAAA